MLNGEANTTKNKGIAIVTGRGGSVSKDVVVSKHELH